MAALNSGTRKASPSFWRTLRVQVGTSPTLLLPRRAARVAFTVICEQSAGDPILLALDGSSEVSLPMNAQIADGDGISVETSGPVYGVASAPVMVNIIEVWD